MKALIAAGAVSAVLVGSFGAPFAFSRGASTPAPTRWASSHRAVGPVILSGTRLIAESRALRSPIFWAGALGPFDYEFTRTLRGDLYVRYVPWGFGRSTSRPTHLVIATYPFDNAFKSLRRQAMSAHNEAIRGPDGSVVLIPRKNAKSVFMAFPRVPFEIEVYASSLRLAERVAFSGLVRPVGY